jgi:hypothetical protein
MTCELYNEAIAYQTVLYKRKVEIIFKYNMINFFYNK